MSILEVDHETFQRACNDITHNVLNDEHQNPPVSLYLIARIKVFEPQKGHFKLSNLSILNEYNNLNNNIENNASTVGIQLLNYACQWVLKQENHRLFTDDLSQFLYYYQQLGFTVSNSKESPIAELDLTVSRHLDVLFDHQVLRLKHSQDFIQHSINCMRASSRSIAISSEALRDDIFTQTEFIDAIATFALADRHAHIRILTHTNKLYSRRSTKLIELARRLPSKINLKVVPPDSMIDLPKFIILDANKLIYFNDENHLEGFCTYKSRTESKSLLERFDHVWQHIAHEDINHRALRI